MSSLRLPSVQILMYLNGCHPSVINVSVSTTAASKAVSNLCKVTLATLTCSNICVCEVSYSDQREVSDV